VAAKVSKPRERWTIAESDGAIFWDGPVKHLGAVAYPVDDDGRVHLDLRLRHAAGTAYELIDYPWRTRHLRAEIRLPVCWPDGSPYKTETFRLDLEVADRDVDWDADYVAQRTLCDGRKVTVRMPMRHWRQKDYLRVTEDPIVVDVAAISPAALPAPAPALAAPAPEPFTVKKAQFFDKAGNLTHSATVSTERRGGQILRYRLEGAKKIEMDNPDGTSRVYERDVRRS
jgi:hypothetical protein